MPKSVFTACLTVIVGTLVYSLGRIIEKFYIEPIHDLRRTIAEIAQELIFWANIYTAGGLAKEDVMNEASSTLRRLSSKLRACQNVVPFRGPLCRVTRLPLKDDVFKAARGLIGLSNMVYDGDDTRNSKKRDEIASLLEIDLGD